MNDYLDITEGEYRWAAEAVASAVRPLDRQTADEIVAQVAFLKTGVAPSRTPDATPPPGPAPSASSALGRRFGEHLTVLERTWAWLYDDDLVSLVDGGLFRPKQHAGPWEANVAATRALERLGPVALRLCLFEGTEKVARAAADRGLADRVTHLDLRSQRPNVREPPVARSFPRLRGLAADGAACAMLLAEGAPALRSLVSSATGSTDALFSLVARLPMLRHLGLTVRPVGRDACWVERVARHPVLERLTSLELRTSGSPRDFPFAAVRKHADRLSGLRRLGLPRHGVRAASLALFDDWPSDGPAVEFLSFDRREALALDIETTGWAPDMR